MRNTTRIATLLRGAALALFVCSTCAPLFADWLVLTDGTRLRGVNARKQGRSWTFLLEEGVEIRVAVSRVAGVEKSPAGETVEFRGERVLLRDKAQTLRKERDATDRRLVKAVETWSADKRGADDARAEIEALPADERARILRKVLLESDRKSARLLASERIAGADAKLAVPALAAAAVRDSYRSVRDSSLRSLRLFTEVDVSSHFVPHLASASPQRRVNAANALAVFPSRRAVPAILKTVHMSWSGFGRGFFLQVTQRAYIADYELVSGGTGFSIIEVADPIVRTTQSGVALDVNVRKVELIARLRALNRATGRDFGTDFAAWNRWWTEVGSKEEVAAAGTGVEVDEDVD